MLVVSPGHSEVGRRENELTLTAQHGTSDLHRFVRSLIKDVWIRLESFGGQPLI